METLNSRKNACKGAEAAQETLNSSETAGEAVDGHKAAQRDRLCFRTVGMT